MIADAQLSYGAVCFTKILHLLFILAAQLQSIGSVMTCLKQSFSLLFFFSCTVYWHASGAGCQHWLSTLAHAI